MKVYVGGLNNSVDKTELQREFQRFGSLTDVWVARNPPGFAFLEFEDTRDAEVCIDCMMRFFDVFFF